MRSEVVFFRIITLILDYMDGINDLYLLTKSNSYMHARFSEGSRSRFRT